MTEMTEQKAIEYFDKELKRDCMVLSPMLEGKKSVRAQFFETAISAMEELKLYKENKLCLIPEDVYSKQCAELDEYKQLGTPEEVKAAVEKQKKVKVIKAYDSDVDSHWCSCGNCTKGLCWEHGIKINYCPECGQKLDWG